MKTIAVISAMPVELESFLPALNAGETKVPGLYRAYLAQKGGCRIALACSGIGKVNAAACTQRVIDEFHPDAVINMGIAGGIDRRLKALDLVIGSEVVYHDFTPVSLLERYHPFQSAFACDAELMRLAQRVGADAGLRCLTGRIASGDCFVESDKVKAHIRDDLGALCCEMEGAPIGQTAFLNGVPFLILRSISDLADQNAGMSYQEFERRAAEQANRMVLGLLGALCRPEAR